MSAESPLLKRTIQHLGYVVPDLRRAVGQWVELYGAGPFFVLEHVPFDHTSSQGEEATLDVSLATGQWGDVPVELVKVHGAAPERVSKFFETGAPTGFHHFAIAVEDAETERARLESLGMRAFLNARQGPIDISFHDATEVLGCPLEVHKAGPDLDNFFGMYVAAAEGWDGSEPFRILDPQEEG